MRKISMKRRSKSANSDPVVKSDEEGSSEPEQDMDESANGSTVPKKRGRQSKGKKTNEANGTDKKKAKKEEKEEENDDEEDDEEYEVEKVVGDKMIKGVRHYLIRWKGHGEDSDTWEPATTVNCDRLVQEYLDSKGSPSKKGKPTKDTKKNNKKKEAQNNDSDSDQTTEEVYEVDKILEVHFKRDGKREFLVHWKGYSTADNTWEPEENMNCQDLIEKFMKKVDAAKEHDTKELRVRRKPTDRYTVSMADKGRKLSKRHQGKAQVHYYDAE